MVKKIASLLAAISLMASSTAFALDANIGTRPHTSGATGGDVIRSVSVSPSTFDPSEGEEATVTVDLAQSAATLYVYVVYPDGNVVVLDDSSSIAAANDYTFTGREDNSSNGDILADGTYEVFARTYDADEMLTDGASEQFILDTDGTDEPTANGVIVDVTLDPKDTFDPSDEELEIEFELTAEVDDLTVIAKKDAKEVEILEEDNADDDEYETEWDGTDDDGDYVAEGEWEIIIEADGDRVIKTITVEYEKPEIKEAFLTKDEIDPDKGEETYLVFKIDAEALVTVELYNDGDREITLIEEEDVVKNKWYAVKWDGTDEDGYDVDEGDDWEFKITAENPVEDDVYDSENVDVDVDEDDVSSGKTNATNDYVEPVIFDDEAASEIEFTYTLDNSAEVYLAVYDGKSASGSAEIELLDYVYQTAGTHTVRWNVKDEDGAEMDDDVYSYKLVTKADGNKKDTEKGVFVIGNEADEELDVAPCAQYYSDLGALSPAGELCEAVVWATDEGIFQGYADGTFRPYTNINRAETLKVLLEAFDVTLLEAYGSNLGFEDLDPYAWYMPYAKTAQFYGMLHGYNNGTEAKLYNNINRVEMLKFALEASEAFAGKAYTGMFSDYADVDVNTWYSPYLGAAYTYDLFDAMVYGNESYLQPAREALRGEVALMLFRMSEAGLL